MFTMEVSMEMAMEEATKQLQDKLIAWGASLKDTATLTTKFKQFVEENKERFRTGLGVTENENDLTQPSSSPNDKPTPFQVVASENNVHDESKVYKPEKWNTPEQPSLGDKSEPGEAEQVGKVSNEKTVSEKSEPPVLNGEPAPNEQKDKPTFRAASKKFFGNIGTAFKGVTNLFKFEKNPEKIPIKNAVLGRKLSEPTVPTASDDSTKAEDFVAEAKDYVSLMSEKSPAIESPGTTGSDNTKGVDTTAVKPDESHPAIDNSSGGQTVVTNVEQK